MTETKYSKHTMKELIELRMAVEVQKKTNKIEDHGVHRSISAEINFEFEKRLGHDTNNS